MKTCVLHMKKNSRMFKNLQISRIISFVIKYCGLILDEYLHYTKISISLYTY